MNHLLLAVLVTVISYCLVTAHAYYLPEESDVDVDPQYRDVLDQDNEDLRKLLLKKLRFREILKEHMKPPEALLESPDEDTNSEARHRANKRHKMEDLVSRVQAYLNSVKERQIKESLTLPSLRFGRSGINWKSFTK